MAFTIAEQVIRNRLSLITTVNEVVKSVLKEAHAGKKAICCLLTRKTWKGLGIRRADAFYTTGATLQVLADPRLLQAAAGWRLFRLYRRNY